MAKEAYVEELHRWYARDRGRSIEEELLGLLRSNEVVPEPC